MKFLVGDMQRQRQELSYAVRQLTDNSNSIYQEMNRNASHMKKRSNSTSWTETDLDSMDQSRMDYFASEGSTPLFIDTSAHSANIVNCSSSSKIADYERLLNGNGSYADDLGMESDDLLENSAFNNLTSQEKQEIKTVRIVKQESERRKRDRERTGVLHNLDQVMEEEAQLFNSALNNSDYNAYKRSQSLPRFVIFLIFYYNSFKHYQTFAERIWKLTSHIVSKPLPKLHQLCTNCLRNTKTF